MARKSKGWYKSLAEKERDRAQMIKNIAQTQEKLANEKVRIAVEGSKQLSEALSSILLQTILDHGKNGTLSLTVPNTAMLMEEYSLKTEKTGEKYILTAEKREKKGENQNDSTVQSEITDRN